MPLWPRCWLFLLSSYAFIKRAIFGNTNPYATLIYNQIRSDKDVQQGSFRMLTIFEINWTILDYIQSNEGLQVPNELNHKMGIYQFSLGDDDGYACLALRPGFLQFINKYRENSDFVVYSSEDWKTAFKTSKIIEEIVNTESIYENSDQRFMFKMILSTEDTKADEFQIRHKTFKAIDYELRKVLPLYDLILIIDGTPEYWQHIQQFRPQFNIKMPNIIPYNPFYFPTLRPNEEGTQSDLIRATIQVKQMKEESSALFREQIPAIIAQFFNHQNEPELS